MAEHAGVMIYGEIAEGKVASITTELLGIGRTLADKLGEELSAVLIGSGIESLAPEIVSLGADKVYVVDDPILADYRTDAYLQVIEKMVNQANPQIVLLGQTNTGRDLAPRLAFRLQTAVSMGAIELSIDDSSKLMLQTKPVYGGNAQITVTTDSKPQMATIRPKSMSPAEPNSSRKGEVVKIDAGLDPSQIRTEVVDRVKAEVTGIKLEEAETIVSGGRGMGDGEAFKQLAELANLLKGAVGSSRPPVDEGWVPESYQVGLTGKIVAPDLYIAVAISGSSQHMSGCSGSKNIIAINKDPEANMVKMARFAVVGDWKKVVPAFTSKVKELLTE